MARFATLCFVVLVASISAWSQEQSGNPPSAPPQSSAPVAATSPALNIAPDTAFLAKLSTNLELRNCKPGDPVEAQATQDIKQGHEVLLKKGSTLLGRVKAVQMPTAEKPEAIVGIVFDEGKLKNGQQFSLHLIIQALAPEANLTNNDTLADGRGMDSATNNATVSGHSSTLRGNVNQLTPASSGIYDLSGVKLGDQITQTGHVTVLAFSNGNVRLKKGMQLVMKVVSQ
jgi:hypothetical protein